MPLIRFILRKRDIGEMRQYYVNGVLYKSTEKKAVKI